MQNTFIKRVQCYKFIKAINYFYFITIKFISCFNSWALYVDTILREEEEGEAGEEDGKENGEEDGEEDGGEDGEERGQESGQEGGEAKGTIGMGKTCHNQ